MGVNGKTMNVYNKIDAHDGGSRIIFSDTFNIYSGKLVLSEIYGFSFELNFIIDKETQGSSLQINGDIPTKKIGIVFTNFNNSLGVGTTQPVSILKSAENNQELLFSVYARTLNDTTPFLQVTVVFYVK